MSLVGTRPPTVDEWEQYEPHHRARMAFRPGLTGLWQVSGRSNITDFEEVVKLDIDALIIHQKLYHKKKITNSREKTGRKPGGQPGHKGHCRKKQEPTRPAVLLPPPGISVSS